MNLDCLASRRCQIAILSPERIVSMLRHAGISLPFFCPAVRWKRKLIPQVKGDFLLFRKPTVPQICLQSGYLVGRRRDQEVPSKKLSLFIAVRLDFSLGISVQKPECHI